MAKLKYDRIYRDLRQKIESGEYPVQEFLPSEFRLIEEYECSRNTNTYNLLNHICIRRKTLWCQFYQRITFTFFANHTANVINRCTHKS